MFFYPGPTLWLAERLRCRLRAPPTRLVASFLLEQGLAGHCFPPPSAHVGSASRSPRVMFRAKPLLIITTDRRPHTRSQESPRLLHRSRSSPPSSPIARRGLLLPITTSRSSIARPNRSPRYGLRFSSLRFRPGSAQNSPSQRGRGFRQRDCHPPRLSEGRSPPFFCRCNLTPEYFLRFPIAAFGC